MRYTTAGLLGLALFGLSLQPCFSQGAPQADRSTASSDTRHGRPAAALNAQRPDKLASSSNSLKGEVNAWTVGVAGGLLEGTFIRYAADLAKALDDGNNLRVIPMVTYGAVGNVTDLLNLRGVDVAITQADVLDHFRREVKVPDIENRIQYISPLFLAEVHIYAREEFKTLQDLAGRKVAFNTPGSAANLTGQVVFQRLGIQVEPVFINNAIALEKMRSGDLSAVVHVVGKPNDLFVRFKPEPGFHFIPVEYGAPFEDYYVPAALESEDYPHLIPSGQTVPTIAVPALLAVFNWPKSSDRYRRVSRFIEAYFTKFDQLQQPPFQPKWREINLAGQVPGWKRYRVAEELLAKMTADQGRGPSQVRAQFDAFLDSRAGARGPRTLTSSEREALFKQFLDWQHGDDRNTVQTGAGSTSQAQRPDQPVKPDARASAEPISPPNSGQSSPASQTSPAQLHKQAVAQAWPEKPVTVIVPFPAGGGTDAFARPLTTELTKRLGKAFIVDNRGGAGGTLGAGPWRRSAPKPHTGTADGVFVR